MENNSFQVSKIWKMKDNPNIWYRYDAGWEYSEDFGQTWYYTQRTNEEILSLCEPNETQRLNDPSRIDIFEGYGEFDDLEVWGDTMDEPIPDEFLEYLLRNIFLNLKLIALLAQQLIFNELSQFSICHNLINAKNRTNVGLLINL